MKRIKEPDVIMTCPRCSEDYIFENIKDLDEIDIKTACTKCGFLLHEHALNKMEAVSKILAGNDQHAKQLLNKGDFKEFQKYIELKTGIKDPEPIG